MPFLVFRRGSFAVHIGDHLWSGIISGALQVPTLSISWAKTNLFFTTDVTSLYTVIPNGEGLLALKNF